jgi:hypothetical protein
VLRGKLVHLLAVLQLKSLLHHLSEGHGIARSARTLVSDLPREVEAIDVAPVEGLRNFTLRNVIRTFVLLHKRLSLLKSLFKFRRIVPELLLGRSSRVFHLGISLGEREGVGLFAVGYIVLVGLSELARVSLPSEVILVHKHDGLVSVLRGHMLQMGIDAAMVGARAVHQGKPWLLRERDFFDISIELELVLIIRAF